MEPVLLQAIGRLETVLARETAALNAGSVKDLAEFSARKNQSLLELTRMSRGLKPEVVSSDVRIRLSNLKKGLDANQRALRLHVQASEEIAGLIARAIEHAESDGTYEAPVKGAQRAK
ncbi:flagellar protein FlgN [Consotaella aegiceratis]|uniref:flagellar protein FlgN n=1 Tax=Consotaella aegiceratis TaxID=3097961 RepID=UPI002F3FC03E